MKQKLSSADKKQNVDLQKMLEVMEIEDQKSPRELVKFNFWENKSNEKVKLSKLEDDANSEPFD
jgi:hypothetical protein